MQAAIHRQVDGAVNTTSAGEVPCNLCGASDAAVVYEAGRAQSNRIVRCRTCGLMYGSPRLAETDRTRVARFDPGYLGGMLARTYDPRMDKEAHQVVDWDEARAWLGHRYPARGRLLEVGCGLGFLARHFQRDGWQAQAVDPDPLCARHATEVLGVPVVGATLAETLIPDNHYELALLSHVIEHVPDPLATLRELHRIVRPGGMVVMETPRFDSLAFLLLGRHERSMACEGHLYFFTRATLVALAHRAGFELVRHDLVGRSLTVDRLLWNLAVIAKSERIKQAMAMLSGRLGLTRLHLRLNARDMQRIYLLKPCASERHAEKASG